MSFGINGPDNNLPAIQKSHHTNDGGAGNLGYFNQRRKRKEKEEEEPQDSFESSTQEDKSELLLNEMDSIGTMIKNFWLTLKSGLKNDDEEKKIPEEYQEEDSEEYQEKNPEE